MWGVLCFEWKISAKLEVQFFIGKFGAKIPHCAKPRHVVPNFKMKRIITPIFLLTIVTISFGQKVGIDTLFLHSTEELKNFPVTEMKFPIIRSKDSEIDIKINTDLKNRFTGNEFPNLPTDSTLIKWTNQSITFLDFNVTYNKNDLISLSITAESCGAYCTMWTDYFTYSTVTGKLVKINEIIILTDKFINNVISDKDEQYTQQKRELKEMLLDKNSGLNDDNYSTALEYYETCEQSFEIKDFALYDEYLQLIHECYLPRMMRHFTPIITLKYNYDEIKEELKIKN